MRRLLTLLAVAVSVVGVVVALLLATIWGPPLFSGALFLLWPGRPRAGVHETSAYQPLHQGHVDVATGLYIREDEDIVLAKIPPFAWRRTYLSGDHVSRQFGVGATNNAEWYLIGDPKQFQWAELIREDGSRIHFDRLTPGRSYGNAVFGHATSPTAFYGALLGWVGVEWTMRLRDGSGLLFQGCGPSSNRTCSLAQIRDPEGHRISFDRDRQGLVRAVSTGSERLAFEYDEQRRIVKASDTSQHSVEYAYDSAGRLGRAVSDGVTRSYTYGVADELLSIREPGRLIENRFDPAGRLSHQTVHRPNTPDYSEAFVYIVAGGSVLETDVTENDGAHTQYRFDEQHREVLESYDAPGRRSVMVSFDRAPGGFVGALTVRCTKGGRRVSETVAVRSTDEERVKDEVIREKCE